RSWRATSRTASRSRPKRGFGPERPRRPRPPAHCRVVLAPAELAVRAWPGAALALAVARLGAGLLAMAFFTTGFFSAVFFATVFFTEADGAVARAGLDLAVRVAVPALARWGRCRVRLWPVLSAALTPSWFHSATLAALRPWRRARRATVSPLRALTT